MLTVVEGNRLVEVRLPSLSESDVKLGDVKFTLMLTAPTSETIVRQIMELGRGLQLTTTGLIWSLLARSPAEVEQLYAEAYRLAAGGDAGAGVRGAVC